MALTVYEFVQKIFSNNWNSGTTHTLIPGQVCICTFSSSITFHFLELTYGLIKRFLHDSG